MKSSYAQSPLVTQQVPQDKGVIELIAALDARMDDCWDPDRKRHRIELLSKKEYEAVIQELSKCQDDFPYASRNYFKIVTKKGDDVSLRLNESQDLVLETMRRIQAKGKSQRLMIIKSRQLGMCLIPKTLVLTSDLRWVPIDDVKPGDEMVSVDENHENHMAGRKMRKAVVLARRDVYEEAYRLTMEDGRELVATGEHRFLCKKRGSVSTAWVSVKKSGPGKSTSPIVPGDHIRNLVRPWVAGNSMDDGWFGGLIDGEGNARKKERAGSELCVCQAPGQVLDRARKYLRDGGYKFREDVDNRKGTKSKIGNKPVHKFVVGSFPEILRLIGTARPTRFTNADLWEGKSLPKDRTGSSPSWVKVVSVEPLGKMRMVDLQTSTKTFIAEGFVSHNSTLIEALIAWRTMFFPNARAIVVSDNSDNAADLFGKMLHIYDHMPWWLKPMIDRRKEDKGLKFDNPDELMRVKEPGLQSSVSVQAATQITGVGQGRSINSAHLCFSPNTLIHTADGIVKPISEVLAGDVVIDSSGALTAVAGVAISERVNELTSEIRLWGQFCPLSTTRDHLILTPEGLRQAESIKAGDYVRIPVRRIVRTMADIRTEEFPPGGGRCRLQSRTKSIPCNFSTGWLLGLFLAEGSIHHNRRLSAEMTPCSIYFGIDVDEVDEFKRKLQLAVPDLAIGTRRSNSRTRTLVINNSGLARFIKRHFGHNDTKRVPDWVWDCGEDFCRGLVCGYLEGDGHTNRNINSVCATSIRLALPIQMRGIIASLGFGWSSILYKEAGLYFGRNCKEAWTLHANGPTSLSMRAAFGWPAPTSHAEAAHWKYSEDGHFVDIEVAANGEGFSRTFYDLEVESPTHQFCTVHCCVRNSEWADYQEDKAIEIIQEDIGNALAEDPYTFAFLESTAKGAGTFAHKLWRRQVALGELAEWVPLFIGWFFDREHFVAPSGGWRPGQGDRDLRERIAHDWVRCTKCGVYREIGHNSESLVGYSCWACSKGTLEPVVLSDGQLYWRHNKAANSSMDAKTRKTFLQEQCSTSEEAFQVSGYTVFPSECIEYVATTIDKRLQENGGAMIGHFDERGRYHAMKAEGTRRQCRIAGCAFDHSYDPNHLKVWQEPVENAQYAIGADVAEGLGGDADYSVAWVNRLGGFGGVDLHVATFRCNDIGPLEFGDFLNFLGRWYNEALMAVEVNKYDSCFTQVRQFHQYPNNYRWKHVDTTNVNSNKWGWWTTLTTKPRLYQTGSMWLRKRQWVIRDEEFYEEMLTFQKLDPEDRAVGSEAGFHDDVVMAALIALYTSHDLDWDENLQYIPTPNSKGGIVGGDQWFMTCSKCGFHWSATSPDSYKRCPNDRAGPMGNSPCRSISITGKFVANDTGPSASVDLDRELNYQGERGSPGYVPSYEEL